jgi:diguanylate cyclase (GGDEF)-like protein/PAS domain S-box-containing protein
LKSIDGRPAVIAVFSKRWTLTYKRKAILFALALNLCLAFVGYRWQAQSKAQHEASAITAVQNLSELLARDIEARFDGIDNALLAIADEYEHEAGDTTIPVDVLDSFIARQLSRQPDLITLRITNSVGDSVYGLAGKKASGSTSLGDRKYFIAHKESAHLGLIISEPLLGKITGQWGLVFSRRLNHHDGSFAGVVYAQLGLEMLESRFSNIDLGPNGAISLRDQHLAMVVRFPRLKGMGDVGANTVSTDFQTALISNGSVGHYFSGSSAIDGVQRAHSYRKLPHYPFYLNVGISKETFLREWRSDIGAIFLFWMVFVVVTSWGTYLLILEWARREAGVEELAKSESRFRSIIELSPVPFAIHDEQGRITYLNSAFEKTLGYRLEDIPTVHDWYRHAYPDREYRTWLISTWKKHLNQSSNDRAEFQPLEVSVRFKDGKTGTVLANTAPLGPQANNANLVSLVDITARKLAEERVAASEAQLKRAELASKSGSWELNVQTCNIFATEGAERIYGVPANGLTLDAIRDIPMREFRASIDVAMQNLVEYDVPYDIEFRIVTPSTQVIKDIHSVAIFDKERGVICGVIQDITERKIAQRALLAAEQFARSTLDAVSEQLCVLDASGKIIYTNESWRRFYEENFVVPRNFTYGIGSNYLDICDQAIGDAAEEARRMAAGIRDVLQKAADSFSLEYACHTPTKKRWFQVRVTPFHGNSGNIVIAHEDVTDTKLTHARLKLSASVFTHAREGIIIADAKGELIDVNETFTEITGYSRDEVVGKNPRLLQSSRHGVEFYREMWAAILQKGFWSGEIWNRRKSGEEYPELLTVSAVRNDAGEIQNFVALFSDISMIKERQHQLEQLARFDELTGLPNRLLKDDRLRQAMLMSQRRGKLMAVVYIDLDGFKAVNDAHGHDVGDALLVTVSRRMKDAMREGDTLARIGGDEFFALLVDLECVEDCYPVLDRMLGAAAETVLVGNIAVQVSASIGATVYPIDNVDADTLVQHADHTMYKAKQQGGNRWLCMQNVDNA